MTDSPLPSFAELATDPEIAPLLNFTPVARKARRPNGWTPDLQREFIALLAWFGIPSLAAKTLDKNLSGIAAIYKLPGADTFRASWDAAVALGVRRNRKARVLLDTGPIPGIGPRGAHAARPGEERDIRGKTAAPGQIINERGEWEDEESLRRRNEEAKDSVATKLLRIRRVFLSEIAECPGKRAAFEILTRLPIDWDKAKRGEPQDDEPYRTSNQREPDMVLMAESGWSFGSAGYGPDKMAELYREVDKVRRKKGLPVVDWETLSTERSDADGEKKSTEGQPDAGAAGRDAAPAGQRVATGEPD